MKNHHNGIYYLYANIKIKEGNTSKLCQWEVLLPEQTCVELLCWSLNICLSLKLLSNLKIE